jgi:integrase
MPTIHFTARTAGSLKPGTGRVDYFDENVVGLALRVTSADVKTWTLLYRFDGRLRRLTLGRFPTVKLAKARGLANDALLRVADGTDPAAEKRAARTAMRFAELGTLYITKHAKPRKKSWRDDARLIRTKLNPKLKAIPLTEIKRRDIRELVEGIAKTAPTQGNRVLALVRKMLNFAIEQDLLEANPAQHVPRPAVEHSRSRVLSESELRALWAATEREEAPVRAFYRLRLLTAQRGGEVVRMRWADLDLTAGWWTIPPEHAKNGLAHRVALNPQAVAIVKSLKPAKRVGLLVFPSSDPKVPALKPIRGSSKRLSRVAKLGDFRGHDLRRTAATMMASAGVSRVVIGKILNHVEPGVTAVYDRASYDAEKRAALDAWGAKVEAVLKAES